jgi:hypothetical protein
MLETCIFKVPSLNLGHQTILRFFLVFLSPTWCQNNVLKLDHDRFHPYLFEFIIYYQPNIQRYIVWDTDSIIK